MGNRVVQAGDREISTDDKLVLLDKLKTVLWLGETRPISPSVVRIGLLNQANEALGRGQPIYISGLARIGKSSLADCLLIGNIGFRVDSGLAEYLIGKQYLQDKIKGLFLNEVLDFISERGFQKREDIESARAEHLEKYDNGSFSTPIHYLNDWAKKEGIKVRLILDEVSKLALEDNFLSYLNKVKNECKNIEFGIILHHNGAREAVYGGELSSFVKLVPEPLDIAETNVLLEHYIGDTVRYDSEFVERLHRLTGGRPIEIAQLLFDFIFSKREEALTSTGALSLDYLNKIANGDVCSSSSNYIKDTCHLRNLTRLSPNEKSALKYLAGVSFYTNADAGTFNTLQTLGLVEFHGEEWRIRGELLDNNLRDYFRESKLASDLQMKLISFLKALKNIFN